MKPSYMQSIRHPRLCALALVFAISPVFIKADEGQVFKVKRLDYSVSLSDDNTHTIAGFLYYSEGFRNRPLQVLILGGNTGSNPG